MSIGIFDSGLGGLTVAKAIQKELPKTTLFYFGDTARVPYGSKSNESIIRFSVQIAEYLQQIKKTDVLVVACNTVSATAIPELKKRLPNTKIYDVITAAVALLTEKASKGASIGVIGTTATIRSDAYKRRLLSSRPDLSIQNQACPLLVPLAEEGWFDHEVTYQCLHIYLKDFIQNPPDYLILGCTHYPLFKKAISSILDPSKTTLIDSAEAIAFQIQKDMSPKNEKGKLYITVSDIPQKFSWLMTNFLGMQASSIEHYSF